MKANEMLFLADLMNSNKVLFRIPVYQRNYDWAESNCNRLLDDIKVIMDTGKKHFLGTICYMSTGDNNGFILHDYVIIDGQQRLTTMMILLKALYNLSIQGGDTRTADDVLSFMQNNNCDENYKIKLKPIKTDNDQFQAMLNDKELDEDGHIYRNYKICEDRLKKWLDCGYTPGNILSALLKLEIVGIALKEGNDDPQVIFESINSTGVALSNADLIRNFLMMGDANQDVLYEDYWLPIEKNLRHGTDYSDLNLFFVHFISYKTNTVVNERGLYSGFTDFFKQNSYTHESILIELKELSEIYSVFVGERKGVYPNRIERLLRSLRQIKQTTCYPFLLHVFYDYIKGVISLQTLENVVYLVFVYLLRRGVCGVPTNSLRGMFTYLYARVYKVPDNKEKYYYEALNKFLFTLTSKDLMPSEKEFKKSLLEDNLYSKLALCRFILMDIENGDNKENLTFENLTIEHIMPQTLSLEWRKTINEEDYEKYLHTLGNLSVTGYNSELSNKSFIEKVEIIKQHSKAVILNQDVVDKTSWTVEDIKNRAERLVKIITSRYSVKAVKNSDIEFEYLKKITLDDNLNQVTGKKLVSFVLNGETYRQNKFVMMLIDVVKTLDSMNPSVTERLADSGFTFNPVHTNKIHITRDKEILRLPVSVRDDIYIETNLSASSTMRFIDSLLKKYEVNRDVFYINIIAGEEKTIDDIETEEDE